MTLDNFEVAIALTKKLETTVPFKVRPGKQFLKMMRERGNQVSAEKDYLVEKLLYTGDEGGILCQLQVNPTDKEAFFVSITHLKIDPLHPLASEVKTYQKQRSQKLMEQDRQQTFDLMRNIKTKPKKPKQGFGS